MMSYEGVAKLRITYVVDGWVGTGVAKPDIKASIMGSQCLRACLPTSHPADGCVQDPMHEEDNIPRSCRQE